VDGQDSVNAALVGIDRVLLLSPISDRLAEHQIAVCAAAERTRAQRVVKVSGSDWTVEPPGQSISGDAHGLVETWLAQSTLEHVSLRPNGWMQVSLPPLIAQIRRGEPLAAGYGAGGIGLIDARDIADVAVLQLTGRAVAQGPLVLTGPQVVTVRSIAAIASRILDRTVPVAPPDRPKPPPEGSPVEGFEAVAVAQFMRLIAEGRAAQTTPTARRILGRPPRSVADYLAVALEAVPA